jgi:Axonemal dynein light chain.
MSKHTKAKSEFGPLPFYSPKNKDLIYDSSLMAQKTKKFLKLQSFEKFSPKNFSNFPLASINRYSYSKATTKELPDWDHGRKVSEFTTERETTIYNDYNEKLTESGEPVLPQIKDIKDLRTPNTRSHSESDEIITKLLGSNTKTEIKKIYETVREFDSLKIVSDEKEEYSKKKLADDKLRKTATQFNRLKTDSSHIFDKKPARPLRLESSRSLSMNLPELIQKVNLNLQQTVEDLHNQELNTPKSVKCILNLQSNNLINNNLTTSNFLKSSKGTRRTHTLGFFSKDSLDQSPGSKNHLSEAESPIRSPMQSFYKSMSTFSIPESNFAVSLKKEIPSISTGAPISRHEVILMSKWLYRVIDAINQDPKISQKEKFSKADEVYQLCLNEIIRQVAMDCHERAELLAKVWKAYIDLTNDILEDYKLREFEIEEKANEEYDRMHQIFLENAKRKDEEIEKLKKKIEEIENYYKKLGERAELAIKQEERALEENKKLHQALNKYKKNYAFVVQENKDLEYKYNKLKQKFDFQEEDSLDLKIAAAEGKQDLDSESSIDEGHQRGQGFGMIKQKIVLKEDKETFYEDLTYVPTSPPVDKDTQTELVLVDARYTKILKDMERINDIYREEVIKERLVHEAEFLENLAQNEELTEQELKRIQLLLRADQIRRRQQGIEDPDASYMTNDFDDQLSIHTRGEESKSEISENPKKILHGLNKVKEAVAKGNSGIKPSKLSIYSNEVQNSSISKF